MTTHWWARVAGPELAQGDLLPDCLIPIFHEKLDVSDMPFLEHFSQAFARFFMRVGLPSSISPHR